MSTLLLRNARCVRLSPAMVRNADIRIRHGLIEEVGSALTAGPGDTVENLHGAVLMPGLVCAHTHLYSSLARGMPGPRTEPPDFPAMLEAVWWKLDRSLNAVSIRACAVAGALEALRCGVTTIVDHHSSPNAIDGSLSIIGDVLTRIGVRGVLCYETSDRDGPERRDAGLAENERFLLGHRDHPTLRGMVGAHASFTLSDESLTRLGELAAKHDTGVHIHLAEDRADPETTRRLFGREIIARFRAHGLLRKRSVFAHAVHLTEAEFSAVRDAGSWLVHNPRSNMNNAVGRAPLDRFGARTALGTDGFTADMFEELRTAYFRNRESETRIPVPALLAYLQNGSALASEAFGQPFGDIREGYAADLVVLDYTAPTPLTAENLPGHVLFGLRSSMVRSVMVDGTWVLRDRRVTLVDEDAELHGTSAVAAELWRRMHG